MRLAAAGFIRLFYCDGRTIRRVIDYRPGRAQNSLQASLKVLHGAAQRIGRVDRQDDRGAIGKTHGFRRLRLGGENLEAATIVSDSRRFIRRQRFQAAWSTPRCANITRRFYLIAP
jgi:hypothetical protein